MRDLKLSNGTSALDALLRHRRVALFIVLGFLLVGVALSLSLKPRFKASGTISISPQYFQNPITRNFMPEITDPNERKAEREALIQKALDVQFLDSLFPSSANTASPVDAAKRRQTLAKAIEVTPMQASAYQISVVLGSREEALTVVNRALSSIKAMLVEERRAEYARLRDTVAAQIRALVLASNRSRTRLAGIVSASRPEMLREAEGLERDIQDQLHVFSDGHPLIKSMNARLKTLKERIAEQTEDASAAATHEKSPGQARLGTGVTFEDSAQRLSYEDLVQKYEYINILLSLESSPDTPYISIIKTPEMPIAPISPNRPLILFWSLLAGIMAALIGILALEWLHHSPASKAAASHSALEAGKAFERHEHLDSPPRMSH
jgi:uncharacterized protein involved in exopolysaccharide biosynthesis